MPIDSTSNMERPLAGPSGEALLAWMTSSEVGISDALSRVTTNNSAVCHHTPDIVHPQRSSLFDGPVKVYTRL